MSILRFLIAQTAPTKLVVVSHAYIDLVEKTIHVNGLELCASSAGIALCIASYIVESKITSGIRRILYLCLDLGRDVAIADILNISTIATAK